MKTAAARATYEFVYFFKNYGGKLNNLRDAEFMNKINVVLSFDCDMFNCSLPV